MQKILNLKSPRLPLTLPDIQCLLWYGRVQFFLYVLWALEGSCWVLVVSFKTSSWLENDSKIKSVSVWSTMNKTKTHLSCCHVLWAAEVVHTGRAAHHLYCKRVYRRVWVGITCTVRALLPTKMGWHIYGRMPSKLYAKSRWQLYMATNTNSGKLWLGVHGFWFLCYICNADSCPQSLPSRQNGEGLLKFSLSEFNFFVSALPLLFQL